LSLAELARDVDLLCLDAGNTVIFLDHARIARWLATQGHAHGAVASSLVAAEGKAKLLQETTGFLPFVWEGQTAPGARGWGGMLGTTITGAGIDQDLVQELLPRLWEEHVAWNLYSRVPEGLGDALDTLRATGVHVAIVSNSEGMLEALFEKLGILRHFDAVFDSSKLGFEKPDPRIFEAALARFQVPASRALHLGDTFATDVVGARAAGMRAALIDPFLHYEGRHADVARVAGVVEVARAIVNQRR
jgi:HAD superfamily hydrolase (TIGR01549 family)